ncbi:acetamidase/formamidase family protein [Acetomicrobium hydrogeniformans]|uniref:Acetamidase/Formamidase family protein n=1 Tax=Acetomicrobium hydrogeniformans ATCC BAA-1850 TaxID=592015 RepID=A0A0T5X7Y5_9BACT|nr:acetamidase/formamidase family protein [Acetomicrobium hydrogeniformans]KRT34572.1 Acetamidase/Formamidase family protein [Acetomicrobium hydrogeniformans ATCC BAA-1850]
MANAIVNTKEMVWVLDPSKPFAGPVKDGGIIVARVSPGCWGAMITPDYPSGHEVTRPIEVEGAEVGDAIIIKVRKINVLSLATTSGTDVPQEGHFVGDPFVAKKCPSCGTVNPETYVEGIGEDAIRCKKCKAPIHPFLYGNTYTILMDDEREVAVTVPSEVAREIACDAAHFSALPPESRQYSANIMARGDLPGLITPLRPMVGNLGTCPAVAMPSSHNAGDFGSFLVGAPHEYALTEEQLNMRTDGHMDINEVVEGSVVIAPVKVKGGGVYVGDVHAMMGDGEIAGHTTDVTAEVVLEVKVIKGLSVEGPIVLPRACDLPAIVSKRSERVLCKAKQIASLYGFELESEALPIMIVGTGKNLNEACDNGLERMSSLTGLSLPEIKNRCTITGQVEIGRLPGVVQVSMLVPRQILEKLNLWDVVSSQYKDWFCD